MDQKLKQDYVIGPNLKALRKKTGLTQAQVAAKLQVAGLGRERAACTPKWSRAPIQHPHFRAGRSKGHIHKVESYDEFFRGL